MLYVKRHEDGILIRYQKETKIIKIGIINYMNQLCMENMATYAGRIAAAKKKLKIKSNVPIYINSELILYPISSVRNYNTVLVNYNMVLSVNSIDNGHTRFIFTNLEEEIFEVSYRKIMKQHSRIKIIIEYLDNCPYS